MVPELPVNWLSSGSLTKSEAGCDATDGELINYSLGSWSLTTAPHETTLPMTTALDKLKATGTVVVSDSGDFDCEWLS